MLPAEVCLLRFSVSRRKAASYEAFKASQEPSFMTYLLDLCSSYALSHYCRKTQKRFSSKSQGDTFSFQIVFF
jgi:hypothetical protein